MPLLLIATLPAGSIHIGRLQEVAPVRTDARRPPPIDPHRLCSGCSPILLPIVYIDTSTERHKGDELIFPTPPTPALTVIKIIKINWLLSFHCSESAIRIP